MKTLFTELVTSLRATLVLAMVLCGLYPVAIWAGGQLLFRDKANGSLVFDGDGTLRGSRLLAQRFTSDGYFNPRPSSAGTGYDAANSAGSNLGPTSQKLADAIKADVATYREKNGLPAATPVPADAVTRSASGLDPHISVANAELQAGRVARARQLPLATVRSLIAQHTDDRNAGILGEPGVNVLLLNRALDAAKPASSR
ncbi:MAG TPA: K(+)-transporting ATPase subunit C [Opitutus sp.]|nr:K(+)-transporting ATPase subunit C [Opitutus sp.]